MGILAIQADERVKDVVIDEDALQVDFMDGRSTVSYTHLTLPTNREV